MKKYPAVIVVSVLLAVPGIASAQTLPELPVINQSLSFRDAIGLAFKHNIMLAQSGADLTIANDAVKGAKSQSAPSVATTTYGTAGDSNNIVSSSPNVGPQNYLGVSPKGFLDQNLTLMAPLFTGSRISSQISAAKSQYMSSQLSYEQVKLVVESDVTDAYTQAVLDSSLVEVAQARLTAEDEQVRITQDRVSLGRSAPVDLLREQDEDASAQQSLLASQTNQQIALVQLRTTLGIDQASAITLVDTLDTISISNRIPDSVQNAIKLAESNNPHFASAMQDVQAAQQNIRIAKSAFSPQVYALGMADDSSGTNAGGRVGYTVGLTASLPLSDGGGRQDMVNEAQARLSRAVLDAESVRQTVDEFASTSWLNYSEAAQLVQTAQLGVTAGEQDYDLATLRYNAGKSIDAERLDALSALTRAQGGLATAKAGLIENKAQLLSSIGSSF